MKDSLLIFSQHKQKQVIFRTIIFVIVFLVILDQFFTLNQFMIKYSTSFDSGYLMRSFCNDRYIEYETPRFQLCENLQNIQIYNDTYSTRYNQIILISSIVTALFFAYVFLYMFIETIFVNPFEGNLLTRFSNLFTNNISIWQIMIYIIKSIFILYLFLLIPLTIYFKFAQNIDISPFVNNPKNLVVHIIFLVVIFLWPFWEDSQSISPFTYSIFSKLYLLIFYLMMLEIDEYQKQIEMEQIVNKNVSLDKNVEYLNFTDKYARSSSNIQNSLVEHNSDVILLLNNIDKNSSNALKTEIGYNFFSSGANAISGEQINNSSEQSVEKLYKVLQINGKDSSHTKLIFFIFLIICAVLLSYFILFFKPDGSTLFSIFEINHMDRDLLYNIVFIPLLALLIIYLIIYITKIYNNYINLDILYEPHNLYKNNIKKINTIFNNILDNDKIPKKAFSVCQNVANAVHMTMYAYLFKEYEKSLFVPNLVYLHSCEEGVENYNARNEYKIETYLKNKLFYNKSKCVSINNDLLSVIMINSVLDNKNIPSVQKLFTQQLNFAIYNILQNRTYDNKELSSAEDFENNNNIHDFKPNNDFKVNEKYECLTNFVQMTFLKYLQKSTTLTLRAVKILCGCEKLPDISNNYVQFLKKIKDTLILAKSNYSANIKNWYIDSYIKLTSELFQEINEKLSKNIGYVHDKNCKEMNTNKMDNNLKISKLIIKNYNQFQTLNSDKMYKFNIEKVSLNPANFIMECKKINMYSDLEQFNFILNNSSDEIVKIFDKTQIMINDQNKIQEHIQILTVNNILLANEKQLFIDLSRDKYIRDNDKMISEIYNLKLGYMSSNVQFFQNFNKTLEEKKENGKYMPFDLKTFESSFQKISKEYNQKYNALENLIKYGYQSEIDSYKSEVKVQDEELYAKQLQKAASYTSLKIYGLIVFYIGIVILANVVE